MAVEEGQSLISLILRSHQAPVLDREQLRRAAAASRAHSNYRERVIFDGATSLDPQDEANLYEDLHEYLRLNVRKRDKEHLIDLVFQVRPSKARQSTMLIKTQGVTSELLKDIITIFYTPLAIVYKAANIADSISDLQAFVDDLLRTVESAMDCECAHCLT